MSHFPSCPAICTHKPGPCDCHLCSFVHEAIDEARMVATVMTLAEYVAMGKAEILEDIELGRVPANIDNFGDLHSYVDANEYGGCCTHAAAFDMGNDIQNILHHWLVAGRPGTTLRQALDAHPTYVCCARLGLLCLRLDRAQVNAQLSDLGCDSPCVVVEINHDINVIEIQDNYTGATS